MKCNYNGCSSKCKGDIDAESCNVLRAYQQGAREYAEWLRKKISQTEKDRQSSYDLGYQQGAKEFAEWLCASHIISTPMGTRMWEDNLIAEWQKGAENE